MSSTRFAPKDPAESVVIDFDFSAEASSLSSPSVACSTLWSATNDTTDIRSGSPQVSGAHVLQRVAGGVDLTDYGLSCTATSASGDILVVAGVLPVRKQPT